MKTTLRNRASYSHDIGARWLSHKAPAWDAINRAEYHLWAACKAAQRRAFFNPRDHARTIGELAAHKAQARHFLELARFYRRH